MTEAIQPSFSSGELAPATYARVDLGRYYTGLRTCRNFMVMPEGGVRNRSGTKFIAETKVSATRTRLIPFQFSTEQTYVLEFGNGYLRFYTNGGQLLSGGLPYEIATWYADADLFTLNYTQSADVLTIVHPNYAPAELRRLGPTNWTLTVINFTPTIAAPAGLSATARTGGAGDTTPFRYEVTAVSGSESAEESLPSSPASVSSWDNKAGANLSWSAVVGAASYNVYKENNGSGIFGFIGRASGTTFTDLNIAPEKTDTPPSYDNPFASGNNPGVVAYYQQRLVMAASNANPQTIWMSRVGSFHNFGFSTPTKDDDAITLTIASRQVNRIRNMVALKELLVLTSGAEWTISGDATGLKPTNVQANVQSYIGSSSVPPAVYGNTALYVQARGQKLADLAYSYTSDGFQGQDLTVLSSHLVRGFEIKDMALAQVPNSVLWSVRNDGGLLGFTYLPAQQVFSWHRHDTDGQFESVASVPEGDEDAVYVVVRRLIGGVVRRYVERFASRQLSVPGEDTPLDRAFFVDSGLTYDGRGPTPYYLTLVYGTDWKYPNPLTLLSGTAAFTVGDVGTTIKLVGDDGENVRVVVTAYVDAKTLTVIPQSIVPASLRGLPSMRWGRAKTTFSGLSHLEGKTVSILADGNVEPQAVVTSGSVSIQRPAMLVHIGLPITSDFETLDMTLSNQPNFLSAQKRINDVTIICEESRGMFAGSDENNLYEFKQRNSENYNDAIKLLTGQAEILISARWEKPGRVFVRQVDPLPTTILGVMFNVQAGG
ncbi:phage nozzle protein [Pseudomonas sp. TMB3-21]